MESGTTGTISADEFLALEQKVLQAVEMIRRERELRSGVEAERDAAKAQIEVLQERLKALEETSSTKQTELDTMQREREAVRERVERMLRQMDEIGG